jgi:hypothetical protein
MNAFAEIAMLHQVIEPTERGCSCRSSARQLQKPEIVALIHLCAYSIVAINWWLLVEQLSLLPLLGSFAAEPTRISALLLHPPISNRMSNGQTVISSERTNLGTHPGHP